MKDSAGTPVFNVREIQSKVHYSQILAIWTLNLYLTVESSQTATFESLNATLIHVKRTDNRQQYTLNADAFSSFKSLWVNKKSFNYFLIDFEAIFDPDLPYPPSYINGSSLGIVSAYSRVTLSKIGRAGNIDFDILKTDILVNIQNIIYNFNVTWFHSIYTI